MLDFTGTDPECERRKRTVRRCVRIATHHGHAWQCRTLFGPNHMNDAATNVANFEIGEPVLLRVCVQRIDLRARNGVEDRGESRCGRRVVVRHRNHAAFAPRQATSNF